MWFNDLDGTEAENVSHIADYFDCSEQVAREILAECNVRHARGSRSESYSAFVDGAHDYRSIDQIQVELNSPTHIDRFGGVDTSDLAQLFHDAWKDGIVRKDRVTIVLDNSTCDAVCECGRCVPNGTEECEDCGSTCIDQQVSVHVRGKYAGMWADHDQTIDGSSWEDAGDDYIYTILSTRKGLYAELVKEGYKVDATDYTCDADDEVEEEVGEAV